MPLTGGTVWDTYYQRNATWKPIGPVVDEWTVYTAKATDGYVCLGVVGNRAHWNHKNTGDHTSRSTHSTIVNGTTVWPIAGWVYAIDGRVPEPEKFERWFAKALRAGRYPHVKYWNILHRHYNRKAGWGTAVYSSDDHLHISFIPGSEYADSTILADYERYRTAPPPRPKPTPAGRPAPGPVVKFPLPSGYYFGPADGDNRSVSGEYGRRFAGKLDRDWLRAWAGQLARRGWAVGRGRRYLRSAGNDGRYGPEYRELIKAFQTDQKLPVTGRLDRVTWDAAYRNPIR